jgi:hypothetical protein
MEQVLQMLRDIDIPKEKRARVIAKEEPYTKGGMVLGLVVDYASRNLKPSQNTKRNKILARALCQIAKEHFPEFVFTSIMFNKGGSSLHIDKNNWGPSMIFAVGDHDGGELWQFHPGGRGEILHIKNNPSMSNGLLPHATLPFLGERFSLVYYCLRSWRESPRPEDAEFLKDLGFWAMDQLPPYKPEDYAPRHDLIPLAAVQLQSILTHYVVAIPSYKRPDVMVKKTLKTLKEGGVPSSVIYIFVADEGEARIYENTVQKDLYNQIVVGVKGIAAQRNFIVKYFPEGQCVVSFDDDVEQVDRRNGSTELVNVEDLDKLLKDAYNDLWKARFVEGKSLYLGNLPRPQALLHGKRIRD